MAVNRPLAPSDSLSIRQPTDSGQVKGNIHNPPRYANKGIGGLNSGSARGLMKNVFAVEPPGQTQRPVKNKSVTGKG